MTESLSIVFSTRDDNADFMNHLRETCGIDDVEILQYINKGEFSLTQIYNTGLREARNTVVVFCHDDIILDPSSHWGRKILSHFEKSDFGILGKAGTTSIPASGKWWEEPHLMVGEVWHQQENSGTKSISTWENKYSGNFGEQIIETIMIDGLFFAVHKKRIKAAFDEAIRGFHFYDIDFSFANHVKGVKVGVVFNFKITHKSVGRTNEQWENNRRMFVQKWKSQLPCHIEPPPSFQPIAAQFEKEPRVAIIIPSKDRPAALSECVHSVRENIHYRNHAIYIVDMGSRPENFAAVQTLCHNLPNVVLLRRNHTSRAHVLNETVIHDIPPDTELLLFCHDDIKLLNDALSRCVQIYLDHKDTIGTIGIRLHCADNSIQHAGLTLISDRNTQLRIKYKGYRSYYGYNPGIEYDIFSNTGAFMMVDKYVFQHLGGFSEHYSEWLEDIDLNVKALLAGRMNFFAGDAVAYHYEFESSQTDPAILSRQGGDLKTLLRYLYQNNQNPNIAKHILYMSK